jgi:rhamnose transport system substrate-binding protein
VNPSVSLYPRRPALLASLCVVLALAACGGSDEGSSAGSAGEEKDGFKIVFIPQNLGIPYFDRMATGFEQAAQANGDEFVMVGPTKAGASEQIPFIQAQAQKGVDAIAIQVNDEDAETPALAQAQKRGIKIASVNSSQLAGLRDLSVEPVDFSMVGTQLFENLAREMDYEGGFVILSATTTAPYQNQVIDDVKRLLKEPKYRGMELLKVVYGNDEPRTAASRTEAALSAYPDMKALFSPTNVGTAAAAQVFDTHGEAGRVILTGNCSPDQVRKFVKSGTIPSCQLWDPATQAIVAGHVLHQMLAGDLEPAEGETVQVPEVGTLTFGKDNSLIAAPELLRFTKDNIDEYEGF